MKVRNAWLVIFTSFVFASCAQIQILKPVSRVSYFHYGGYGDTVYATLNGQVLYLDTLIKSKDSLTALADVSIKILEYERSATSDSNGQFVINLHKGIFDMLVSKEGFQPLLIKNYVSDPDQFSDIKIYLEKGKDQQTFLIPAGGTD